MTKRPVEAPAQPNERRRHYSDEAKRRIVEETCQPNASVSAVARRYRLSPSQVFRWRRALGMEPLPERAAFLPIALLDDEAVPATQDQTLQPDLTDATPASTAAPAIIVERPTPGIEVSLADGRRVRFDRDVDSQTIRRVISTLEDAAS